MGKGERTGDFTNRIADTEGKKAANRQVRLERKWTFAGSEISRHE